MLRQEDGRELEVGGADVRVLGGGDVVELATLHVERDGKRVIGRGRRRRAARVRRPSSTPTARVSIGVRGAGGTGVSLAHNLRITRR